MPSGWIRHSKPDVQRPPEHLLDLLYHGVAWIRRLQNRHARGQAVDLSLRNSPVTRISSVISSVIISSRVTSSRVFVVFWGLLGRSIRGQLCYEAAAGTVISTPRTTNTGRVLRIFTPHVDRSGPILPGVKTRNAPRLEFYRSRLSATPPFPISSKGPPHPQTIRCGVSGKPPLSATIISAVGHEHNRRPQGSPRGS